MTAEDRDQRATESSAPKSHGLARDDHLSFAIYAGLDIGLGSFCTYLLTRCYAHENSPPRAAPSGRR